MDSHALVLAGLVLGALFCWAIWGIFDKKALECLTPVQALILTYIWYVPAFVLALPVSLFFMKTAFTPIVLVITALASFCNALSVLAYLRSLSLSEASYVLGITAGYPIVMQFLAVGILHEQLVLARVIGSILITGGIFLIGFSQPAEHKHTSRKFRIAIYVCLFVATFGWGLTAILDKLAIDASDAVTTYVGRLAWNAAFLIVALAIWMLAGNRLDGNLWKSWKYPALSSVCLIGGLLCYMGALSLATASYVVVITSCYPLITYLFALYLLKEKWNRLRFLGVVILVAGGIVTQTTSTL